MRKVLITGAKGFIGRNIVAELEKERDMELLKVDVDLNASEFERFLGEADFVLHLAGVNRPVDESEFVSGNAELTAWLTRMLSSRADPPPVLLTSSVQSDLDNAYGQSKRAAENAVFQYGREQAVDVYVYKLPNMFGKWSRPNYNSVVATFCHNIARGLPIQINDPERRLTLCYIDDLLASVRAALGGTLEPGADGYCAVEKTYETTLGELAEQILAFRDSRQTLFMPPLKGLAKALYSTYLSCLEPDDFAYELTAHSDVRGSFYELMKTSESGQTSVSTTAPGVTRGNHWHHTKVEKFIVVSGQACIRFRKIGSSDVEEYRVSGDKPEAVDIPAGYTHSLTNTSESEVLITLIWANELFDEKNPDTFYEEV